MTPKQIERTRKKIGDIRRILAAEKRKFGGFFDNRGLRYVPPKYYVQLQDYKGGLTYLRWFQKNFPTDVGMPDFLFEWTIILFKTGKLKLAEKKAAETFSSNTYLFDKFFGRELKPIDDWEHAQFALNAVTQYFTYSDTQPELADFSAWLLQLTTSEKFISFADKFIQLKQKLNSENDREMRHYIILQEEQLVENF